MADCFGSYFLAFWLYAMIALHTIAATVGVKQG